MVVLPQHWPVMALLTNSYRVKERAAPSPSVIAGPITRARARQLNHKVSSLLSSCSSYLDCGDPCTLVLLRNQGEDREGKGLARVGFGLQKSIDL